jgi:2'-5' RNA ligase
MSHAVVGLLDRAIHERVHELRRGLADLLGTDELDALPLPHLSLAVCRGIDLDPVASAVERVAPTLRRTVVRAEPWAVFAETNPVPSCAVVRAVTRSPELDALREGVAAEAEPGMQGISPHTTTATWNPHITLASQGVPLARLGQVIDHLVGLDEPIWEGRIERVALIVEEGSRHRLDVSVELPA